ncbi:hypothetical protein FSP39_008850 [Pinctada imbricata]|uniref:Uncharacterized protein n=1 Tax=Pinctada imbricata TaxID=66713 RepID=A0AA88XGL6_PINIB|nr:hypothetical protein FSP39_008850 [Pinctada imbricata]
MTPLLFSGASNDPTSMNSSYASGSGSSHPVSFFLSIVFGIVLNLPLLVCDLVLNFILEDNSQVLTAWQSIVLLYKMVMLVMAIAIFVHLSKIAVPDGHSKKLAANEYILIFSAAGSVALLTFGIIAGIQTRNLKGDLALADSLVDIVTIYVQTVLVIHSERKRRRTDVSIRTCCATEHLIILLSICNFVFWVTDSFIDFKYKKDLHIEECYFGKTTWNKVREILFPILIFYRFHVSIDLYGFFCKFRN